MNASNSHVRSEDEDGAVEENGEERQAALDRTPNQSNGAKRARSSPLSFGTEEKKDEIGTKLLLTQENLESKVEPMKIAEAPESSSVTERAAIEDNPPPIREEEEEEKSAASKQQQRPQQRDNAESGYSNKARTSVVERG